MTLILTLFWAFSKLGDIICLFSMIDEFRLAITALATFGHRKLLVSAVLDNITVSEEPFEETEGEDDELEQLTKEDSIAPFTLSLHRFVRVGDEGSLLVKMVVVVSLNRTASFPTPPFVLARLVGEGLAYVPFDRRLE